MARVLIIDDDTAFSQLLGKIVHGLGHDATLAYTLKDGLRESFTGGYDAIFLDVGLPDGDGLETLPKFRENPEAPEVVIITGSGALDGAEAALKNGAWDYLTKPVSKNNIILTLVRVLQYGQEKKIKPRSLVLDRMGIVGDSATMRACLEVLAQAAASDAPVLINGETGTGKELFAEAIHQNSRRAGKKFVVVDCASLPVTLAESILFGYEKGAFTGADRAHEGLVKQADGGTLFLDEVGELPLALQKSFLRVIQGRRFYPLGSKREVTSDFRLVAATHRNLEKMVQEGQFREDLLFRLQALTMELPPLRERREDIKSLTIHYLEQLCAHYGWVLKGFTPEFLEAMQTYSWPGNVRELINTLERTLAAALDEPTLFPKHLPLNIRLLMSQSKVAKEPKPADPSQASSTLLKSLPSLRDYRENMDQEYFKALLSRTNGNVPLACKISGLSRSSLYSLLKKHSL
jgi:two-component system NtrC family response regulator